MVSRCFRWVLDERARAPRETASYQSHCIPRVRGARIRQGVPWHDLKFCLSLACQHGLLASCLCCMARLDNAALNTAVCVEPANRDARL